MPLVLSVLRCPDRSVPEEKRVAGGEYTIGRGAECDWVLPDPDRVLSKRHCTVEYLAGGWQLRDLSTNGTFLNGAAHPVGRDATQPLRDGDRLRLGAWEIECRISDERGMGAGAWESASAIPDPMAPRAPASDIFSAPLPGLAPAGGTPLGGAPLLPADFDPFAPEDPGPVMPDHRPSTNDVFVPPRATMPDLLPADWAAPPAPKPPVADPFAALPDPFADAPPPTPATLPDPFADLAPPPVAAPLPDPFADLPAAPPPAAAMPPPIAERATPAAQLPDPFADLPPPVAAAPTAPFADLTPPPSPAGPPTAAPIPPPPVMAASAPPPSADALTDALAILLRAAGMPPPAPGQDAARALEQAGQALAAAVSGMRALLIARADVKREFRIEQTMLRAVGNNAVKFAATDEAALQALISGRGDGVAAVREAVDDLTAHQLATVTATQAAARALLGKLSPDLVEQATPAGGFMPGAREKRMWEVYRRLHQQVVEQFDDDFDSAFGKAFARAYEQALRKGG